MARKYKQLQSVNKDKVSKNLCLCGCGRYTPVHEYYRSGDSKPYYVTFAFIKEHAKRGENGYNPKMHNPRLCACGCDQYTTKSSGSRGVYNKYIKGHENIGRIPWNKGGTFSEAVRKKMSLAKRGVTPANKVDVDMDYLRYLYLKEKRNSKEVSKLLNVSIDVVKNRIRGQKWVRTTKESCSLEGFKKKMRKLQVARLSYSNKVGRGRVNNLERKMYNLLEQNKIKYIPQYPMYNKFVVDAYLPQHNAIIEAFGYYWHKRPEIATKDSSKRAYLEKCGHKVFEVWEDKVNNKTINRIVKELKNGKDIQRN